MRYRFIMERDPPAFEAALNAADAEGLRVHSYYHSFAFNDTGRQAHFFTAILEPRDTEERL